MNMSLSPAFWTAFLAGAASPVSLYAAPPPYMAYAGDYSPARSFGIVGAYWNEAFSKAESVKQPEQSSFTFE
jgi:hypothetical protein